MIRPWPSLASEALADYPVFRIRRERRRSPRTDAAHDFYVLECPDWVNVIALTPEQGVILIHQFRHGTQSVELEIPGGVMDPADASPVAAAVRELREETGYEGGLAQVIGQVAPNPAILNNTCYTVLIQDCVRRHEVELDLGEDLQTEVYPVAELPGLVATGRIRHSLVVAAIYYFELEQLARMRSAAARGSGAA